jgi:C4-dicarboxylate-specific signal transduction histidine kinase
MFTAYLVLAQTIPSASDAVDLAQKGGTLGMQALLLLLLGVCIWLFLRGQKDSREDREKRFKALEDQNVQILSHHEDFAKTVKEERAEVAESREAHFKLVVDLQRETNAALSANTLAIQGLSASLDRLSKS